MAARPSSPTSAQRAVARNIRTIVKLEQQALRERTLLDRLSDLISRFASGPWFLILHVAWFVVWISFNTVARRRFDPFPFSFLTFTVSLEAIFLASFILISQNHFEKVADRRAQLDLQINLLAEAEMTKVLQSLMHIAGHLGIDEVAHDVEAEALASKTDVESVASAVTEAAAKPEQEPSPRRKK